MTNDNQSPTYAALYCRVACKNKHRIKQQLQLLENCAEKHGFEVFDVYLDNGHGGHMLNRPALDRMRRDIKRGGVGVVLTRHPDRLSRNIVELFTLLQEIQQQGTRVCFTHPDICSTDDSSLFAMLFLFNQLERKMLSEYIKRGLQAKRAREEREESGNL